MNRVFLLLGSNIEKETNLPAAIALLHTKCQVVSLSSIYETVPMGLKEQPNFFNIAALIETDLDPGQIKQQIIKPVEIELRRRRVADKNAPRTIDVDIILYNEETFDYTPEDGVAHHIPDPDLLRFAHVAVPIAELAPDKCHPETGQTLAVIATRLLTETNEDEGPILWKRENVLLGHDPKPGF